ncbi:DUF1667 domain-containing protein [Cetobacterium sp. 2A]|uniref:DUF1667 domain-containing protein n=1 Tax=unclassified Cetobacterium TaxID=2630983 RepID=UPI00163C465B|nr:DUF1667 domain-containing protein [Cetobacterium sp. 2A]MBC2855090.1 DUF1667 domain-containing protein [Cetobacterium sp. 2A]
MVNMICIVCPIGCHLQVDVKNNYAVTGNACPRGEVYGKEELVSPKRVVTSTIKIIGGIYNRVPVKTNIAIPKEKVFECMKLLNDIEIKSPVKMGHIVLKNILGTDADIVITRDM